MFVGEITCFIFLAIKIAYEKSKAKEGLATPASPGTTQASLVHQKTNINPLWLAIPASCDFMASTLMFVALTMVPASIY